jgi:Flp pilus assembly protein TadD
MVGCLCDVREFSMLPAQPLQSAPAMRSATLVVVVLSSALLLAGCQNKAGISGGDQLTTGSIAASGEDVSFRKTEELAQAWKKNRGDAATGLAYAAGLQRLGQQPQAMQVLQEVAAANPSNAQVQARIGKALLAAGDANGAAAALERATAADPKDWQALSALGSTYDQMSRHSEAREKYQQALAIKPDAVPVRNNYAMSYALQGKLPEAEKMLRELMNATGANAPRVRQNLALVVGLQGRFDEARKIASEDLPPNEVEANLAYLQQMLSQPNTWKQLQEGQG